MMPPSREGGPEDVGGTPEALGGATTAEETSPPPDGGGPLAGEPSRMSPAAVAIWTLEGVYALVLAVLAGGAQPSLGAAIIAFAVAANAVRYLRFRWRLEPGALVIEQGLVRRLRRVIPRDRIHTVDLERKMRHRVFGVVEVRVETMGGGETEGSLAALGPATAEELRRRLLTAADRSGQAAAEPADPDADLKEVAWIPPGRLVAAGLTGGRVGVGAALVGAGLQFVPERWIERVVRVGAEEGTELVAATGVRLVLLFVFVAIVAGFLISLAATVLTYWDFTLAADRETLRVRRGLLTLRRDTVPLRRVQAVRVEENLVRRLLGLAAVRVTVAGRGGEDVEDPGLILPIGERTEAFRLARQVAGYPGTGAPVLQPMPSGARERRVVRAVSAALAAGGLVLLVSAIDGGASEAVLAAAVDGLFPAGAAGLLAAALAVPLALGAYRNLGWADHGTHVVVAEGVVNRRTTLVEVNRLQTLETTATPFQRRRRLATLLLGIPRPPAQGRTPRALDLRQEAAGRLREELADRIRRPSRGSGA